MPYTTQLLQLVEQQDGLILTRAAEEAGIPRQYLIRLVRKGVIERAIHKESCNPSSLERLQLIYCTMLDHESQLIRE